MRQRQQANGSGDSKNLGGVVLNIYIYGSALEQQLGGALQTQASARSLRTTTRNGPPECGQRFRGQRAIRE